MLRVAEGGSYKKGKNGFQQAKTTRKFRPPAAKKGINGKREAKEGRENLKGKEAHARGCKLRSTKKSVSCRTKGRVCRKRKRETQTERVQKIIYSEKRIHFPRRALSVERGGLKKKTKSKRLEQKERVVPQRTRKVNGRI